MVEKRPFPGDHDSPNGTKRPRPEPTMAASSLAEKIALAKAKAAAMRQAGGAVAAPPALSKPHSPSPAPTTSGNDSLAAIRARVAAMNSKAAAPPSDQTAPAKPGNRQTESEKPEAPQNPYFNADDPQVTRKVKRVPRTLAFNLPGKYLDQASRIRQLNRMEEIKRQIARSARLSGLDENSERNFIIQPPVECEWWDEILLEEKTYDSQVKIDGDDSVITSYVQHPPVLKAAQERRLVEIQPMYLTPKEQAKLRRMRRAAELKEEQAKIRLGLRDPDPPKIRRANLMRVLGQDALLEPTRIEQVVEAQIKEREDKHIQANAERKLTKEERLAKLEKNQLKDAKKGIHMAVFRITDLSFGKLRFRIDQNAKQHSLTGITIFNPHMNLVIVEGGEYGVNKYKKMMARTSWTENSGFASEAQEEKQARDPQWLKPVDENGTLRDLSNNKASLIFEGEVSNRVFRKWGARICETDGEAREVLSKTKLDSMWALALASD
ncbi:pre-mRNA processing factor 3-domain-containing protein [Lophiotrema nucula]|uniref:Pre-mRNA processing factor 3-domain-containing protein n=1 Tax=Lophiotrema nucula TaxID=690887 RepID=A0A6A5YRF1_9PLEO|nr:pre-mRNA processing factor 3-domain-containing protein [Lophiotrema nucula]